LLGIDSGKVGFKAQGKAYRLVSGKGFVVVKGKGSKGYVSLLRIRRIDWLTVELFLLGIL